MLPILSSQRKLEQSLFRCIDVKLILTPLRGSVFGKDVKGKFKSGNPSLVNNHIRIVRETQLLMT